MKKEEGFFSQFIGKGIWLGWIGLTLITIPFLIWAMRSITTDDGEHFFAPFLTIIIPIIICLALNAKAFYDGLLIIDQSWVGLVEIFGKYVGDCHQPQEKDPGVLTAGKYFLFPYFGWVKIHGNTLYFSKTNKITIFKDKNIMVDYLDGQQSGVVGHGDFEIVDFRKAIYETKNFVLLAVEKIESSLRVVLSGQNFEQANKDKKTFDHTSILCKDELLNSYGIKLIGLEIVDFPLSARSAEIRQRRADDEEALNKAQKDAEIDKIKTDAEFYKIDKLAAAKRKEIKDFARDNGITAEKALGYFAFNKKYESVKDSDKLIIEGNTDATIGANFGFGETFAGDNTK